MSNVRACSPFATASPLASPLPNLLSISPRGVCSFSVLSLRKVDYDERWGALAKLMAMPIRKVVFNAQARNPPLSPERPICVAVMAMTFLPVRGDIIVPLAHPLVVGYRIETFDIYRTIEFSIYRIVFVFALHTLAPPVFFYADIERTPPSIKMSRSCRLLFFCLSVSYRTRFSFDVQHYYGRPS